jgi:two-component system, NarL family, response regulator NreC
LTKTRTKAIRILLADDHGIVRQGLRAVLARDPELEVVGESADGSDAVRLAEALDPSIVIMDIAMPHLNGIDATARIVKESPGTGVIILSMHGDETYLLRALNAGAKGYLLKDSAEGDLIPAVHAVAEGRPFFSSAIAGALNEEFVRGMRQRKLTDSWDLLTEREKEVVQLIAEGKSNKEVAAAMDLSPYTVETHRSNMMQKLDLHNTAEIVLYAVRKKIIS